jgi:hypothetical protein
MFVEDLITASMEPVCSTAISTGMASSFLELESPFAVWTVESAEASEEFESA